MFKTIARQLPLIGRLLREMDDLRAQRDVLLFEVRELVRRHDRLLLELEQYRVDPRQTRIIDFRRRRKI
jgi:hypothetical protein